MTSSPRGKTIGILVARMTSSRLPGKSLRMVCGKPLVGYTLQNMQAVPGFDEIWLATTANPQDAPLVEWAQPQGIQALAYTGETDDVVGRISAVLKASGAERFITALGDCPFVDPRIMQAKLDHLEKHPDVDMVYIAQREGRNASHFGIMCCTTEAWQKIDAASTTPAHREHLASVLKTQPQLICQELILDDPLYYSGNYRLCVDTQVDLDFVTHLIQALIPSDGGVILFESVIRYLNAHPEIAAMNQHVHQRTIQEVSQKVLFITQAGAGIGLGHLNRCKALARTLEEFHAVSSQFWLDSAEDFPDVNRFKGDWAALLEALHTGRFHRIVIDTKTPVSADLIQALRSANPALPMIALDNLGPGVPISDLLIIPNAHSQLPLGFSMSTSRIITGKEFILLGPAFITGIPAIQKTPSEIPNLLVTLGGSDPQNTTLKIIQALQTVSTALNVDIVLPRFAPMALKADINAMNFPRNIRLNLHDTLPSLFPLMSQATLACCGFGVTAYELAALGIPAIIFGHAPDQVDDMNRFTAHQTAISLGYGKDCTIDTIQTAILDLLNHPEKQAEMAQAGKALVDGLGAQRIAQVILTKPNPLSSLAGEGAAVGAAAPYGCGWGSTGRMKN